MMRALLAVSVLLLAAAPVTAQEERPGRFDTGEPADTTEAPEDAWTPFFRHEGVALSFIHYRQADSRNDGVVVRLVNENDYAVRYRFRLAFLAAGGEHEEWKSGRATGVLEAGQMKTGSKDGLFWVPFTGGRGIAEIRLPEYQVVPVE